jgi:hypothetical protein
MRKKGNLFRRRKRAGIPAVTSSKKRKRSRRRKADVRKLLDWDTVAGIKAKEFRVCRSKADVREGRKLYACLFEDREIPTDAVHFWKLVRSSPARFSLAKHRKTYLRAVVAALAILEDISQDVSRFQQHLNVMGELTHHRPTSPYAVPVRMVLQLAIDYRCGDNADGVIRQDHRRLSRDALALQWLIQQNVSACEVIAYQKKHGGGLDRWSRLANKTDEVVAVAQAKAQAAIEAQIEKSIAESDQYYDDTEPGSRVYDLLVPTERQVCKFIAQAYEPPVGASVIMEFIGTTKDTFVRLGRTRMIGKTGRPGRNRIEVARVVKDLFGDGNDD